MNTNATSKPKLFSTLGQLCKFIPTHRVARLARETGANLKARTFTPWSHRVTLLYAQLVHSLSLNDVCDALNFVTGKLQAIRGAKAPPRAGKPARLSGSQVWPGHCSIRRTANAAGNLAPTTRDASALLLGFTVQP